MAGLTRIDELILKRLLGEITEEEESELQALGKASAEDAEFIARMRPEAFHKRLEVLKGIDDDQLDRRMKEELSHIPDVLPWISARTWMQRAAYALAIAASILLICFGCWWIFKPRNNKPILPQPVVAKLWWQSSSNLGIGYSEAPACNTIDLGDMEEGKAYKAGRVDIARMGNEFFVYQWQDSAEDVADPISYHLTVAGGSDIQVFFQDTIRVQISPSSNIAFHILPPGIPLKEKEFACNGQVLFDVKHNAQIPVVVKTPKQQVLVLGTLFRVHDFSKEDTGAVFCYAGKVVVKDQALETQTLEASQRLTTRPKKAFLVSTGDFPPVHWSSPELFFDFSELTLDSAMNQIAHWYGVPKVKFDPEIKKHIPGTVFTGKISRYLTLKQLLAILDTNDLHYLLVGRTILVKGNECRPAHNH